MMLAFGGPNAHSWVQVGDLFAAAALGALIGLEREAHNKHAGLRTNSVIAVASAVFMQVSKYGFSDVLGPHVQLDPSRVAAQIVTGIGFVGAGLIFVRGNDVRGLTTASTTWLTAAVGMACGAGLVPLGAILTALHLAIVFVFGRIEHRIGSRHEVELDIGGDDLDVMDAVVRHCEERGFTVREVSAERMGDHVQMHLEVRGDRKVEMLLGALRDVSGVATVRVTSD